MNTENEIEIFSAWLKKNLPNLTWSQLLHRGRYIGELFVYENKIRTYREIPGYHEAFAYVFLRLLTEKKRNRLYSEYKKRISLLFEIQKVNLKVSLAEKYFSVEKIIKEHNINNDKKEETSNFKILQDLANEFFQYTKFGTTYYLEKLKKEDKPAFENYLTKSSIIKLFKEINNKVYTSKIPIQENTPFDSSFNDSISTLVFYRYIHDNRSPLKIILDLDLHISKIRLIELPDNNDLEELEQY